MNRRPLWRLASRIRGLIASNARLARLAERLFARIPFLWDVVSTLAHAGAAERYRAWIDAYDTVEETDLVAMRELQGKLVDPPLLSVVIPVSGASEAVLERIARSLRDQVYDHWEAFFVGGVSRDPDRSSSWLDDPRLRRLPASHMSSAEALNAALARASGDFVVLAEPAVALRPHTLLLFASAIQQHPDGVLFYADEDRMDDEGNRFGHYFKPDWNEALLCSQNYFGALVAVRRSRALAVGAFRDDLDGDCAWGLFLRIAVGADREVIHHLPFILSHRLAPHSDKAPDRARTVRVHERRLMELGRPARVEPAGGSSYLTHYALPDRPPRVSVVVPTTARPKLLGSCLDGVLERTSYDDLEVLVVVSEGDAAEQEPFLQGVASRPHVRVLSHANPSFNFSRVNNWAVTEARGELVCFLNDDVEVAGPEWLREMVAHALQDRVAAAGALLLFPNGRIQHAGVLLGVGDVAGHASRGRPKADNGYHDRAVVTQDFSCVTAACMVVRRDAFLDVGGFDEELDVRFNDVDLCLRLGQAGWRIVWTPSAVLYHHESASTGPRDCGSYDGEDSGKLIHGRWGDALLSDPHYNPNLSLDALELWEPAFPPRVSYPWNRNLCGGGGRIDALRDHRNLHWRSH